jgi:hypothetical protein
MEHYRQGDVLFVKVDALPDGLQRRKSNVIVEGESTGHAHRLQQGAILETGNILYLSIEIETHIIHEEHKPIILVPGQYQVIRQREYSPEAIRTVID